MADEGGFTMEDSMTGRIDWLAGGAQERAYAAVASMADDVQEYAQSNAPWADITGEARSGLTAEVMEEGNTISLILYHTAEHGQWLETIQSGRFAIIMPTLEVYAPQVFARAGARFTGVGGE